MATAQQSSRQSRQVWHTSNRRDGNTEVQDSSQQEKQSWTMAGRPLSEQGSLLCGTKGSRL